MEDFFKIGNNISFSDESKLKSMGFGSCKNELEIMKLFIKCPPLQDRANIAWIMLIEKKNPTFCTSESIDLREQGNKLFRDSPEKNALDACRLYTKAIFAAPPASEALALAHANRAMALQKYGYFQQAYDDCECALEQGYPINLRHKIHARQAACAEKLGEAALLQKHLDSLATLSLNKTYTAQLEELQQGLEKLKLNERNSEKNEQHNEEYRAALRITETASKGRCLIAENSIKKDELIFSERACSFIPASKKHVCHHCAITQLIPFPCYNCNGKVVYCSLKCRIAHQVSHSYECLAYQQGLFDITSSLPLRMVLDEIPEMLSFLRQKRTAKDIWNELTCEKSSLMQSNIQHTQSLYMKTYLEKKPLSDMLTLANDALFFTWYLRYQKDFFMLFKNTKASIEDWQLVIASLLLRHSGQLEINGEVVAVLTVKIADPFDSTLLVNKLWQCPFHVRRGFLHMFCNYEDAIVANFPYLSLCNNACYPTMITKKNGRYLSAYAVNDIEAGAEILNSYTKGYRHLRRSVRQGYLMKQFHFECKCIKCTKENPDADYERYHQFRCEKCSQVFVATTIRCTKCHALQNEYYKNGLIIQALFNTPSKDITIQQVLKFLNEITKAFKGLDRWLLGPHDIKFLMSLQLVQKCFEMTDIVFSSHFDFYNFSQIIEILKFHLRYRIERYHLKTIEYAGPMTYLWDFIAMGKYQCTAAEMREMLQVIDILPDETGKLFTNYYNDYIVGNTK